MDELKTELINDIINEKRNTAHGIRLIQDSLEKNGGIPNKDMYAVANELESDADRLEAAYRREKNFSENTEFFTKKIEELNSLFESIRSSILNVDLWLQSVGSSLSLCQSLIVRSRKALSVYIKDEEISKSEQINGDVDEKIGN